MTLIWFIIDAMGLNGIVLSAYKLSIL